MKIVGKTGKEYIVRGEKVYYDEFDGFMRVFTYEGKTEDGKLDGLTLKVSVVKKQVEGIDYGVH